MRGGRGSAPGKVILLGEHAVVYGHPALAAALKRRVFVELAPADALQVKLPDDRELPPEALFAVEELLARFKLPPQFTVHVRSELPLGGGLGSSAALGVALARAAADATGRLLEPAEAAQHALLLERVFHGAPSGVDPAVSANEGVILFTRALDDKPAQLAQVWPNKPVHLVIAPTGIMRGTRSTVLPMADRRKQRPRLFDPLLAFLGELARGGKDALERGDVDDLGVRFDAAHGVLAALGVSCPELDALVVALRRAGAAGAKLTGAGGGGAAIALAREAEHAARIADRIGGGAFATVVS